MRSPAPLFSSFVAAIVAIIASSCVSNSLAQLTTPVVAPGSATPASATSATYADESIIIEHLNTDYTFAADGTRIRSGVRTNGSLSLKRGRLTGATQGIIL